MDGYSFAPLISSFQIRLLQPEQVPMGACAFGFLARGNSNVALGLVDHTAGRM
jgi:hypothetical protein